MFKTPFICSQLFQVVQARIVMLFLMSFLMFFASVKVSAGLFQVSNSSSMKFLYENQSHFETETETETENANPLKNEPFSEANSENKNESEERVVDFEIDEFLLHTIPIYFNDHLKIVYSLEDLSLTLPPWVLLPLIPPSLI